MVSHPRLAQAHPVEWEYPMYERCEWVVQQGIAWCTGEGLVALQHHIPKRVCGGDIIPSEDLTNHATPRNTLLLGEHPAPKVMTSGTTHYYMSYLRREHHIPLPGGGPFPVRTL